MTAEAKIPIVEPIIRAHAEFASFFWLQRQTLAMADPTDPAALARVSDRLAANLDGLLIAGEAAWPLVVEQFEDHAGPGELFVAAFLAIVGMNDQKIAQVVDYAKAIEPAETGLRGGLSWLSPQQIGYLVRLWIGSTDPFKCRMATAAIADHRVDVKNSLGPLLSHTDVAVRIEAYRLAGLTGRRDALGALRVALETEADAAARLQAAIACVELGDKSGLPVLRSEAAKSGPDGLTALRLAVSSPIAADAREWLGSLHASDNTSSVAVRGAGMLGDRSILPWLIRQMHDPALADAAGRSFLELFPEARSRDDLFSMDTQDFDDTFSKWFGEDVPVLPVASRIAEWGKSHSAS